MKPRISGTDSCIAGSVPTNFPALIQLLTEIFRRSNFFYAPTSRTGMHYKNAACPLMSPRHANTYRLINASESRSKQNASPTTLAFVFQLREVQLREIDDLHRLLIIQTVVVFDLEK
jgi:hypothetical protein